MTHNQSFTPEALVRISNEHTQLTKLGIFRSSTSGLLEDEQSSAG